VSKELKPGAAIRSAACQEIDDLPTALLSLRRPGSTCRHAVQAFVQQRAQRPAGAIAAEHVEVVDVDVACGVLAGRGG